MKPNIGPRDHSTIFNVSLTSVDDAVPPVPPPVLVLALPPPPPPSEAAEEPPPPEASRPSPVRRAPDRPTGGGCPARCFPLRESEDDDDDDDEEEEKDEDEPATRPDDGAGMGEGEETVGFPPPTTSSRPRRISVRSAARVERTFRQCG